jgi:hypothetical protein
MPAWLRALDQRVTVSHLITPTETEMKGRRVGTRAHIPLAHGLFGGVEL